MIFRNSSPAASSASWLRLESFDYACLNETLAVVCVQGGLASDLRPPAGTRLVIQGAEHLSEHAPAGSVIEHPAPRRRRGASAELLWRATFAIELEVVEFPRALFELSALERMALELPAPDHCAFSALYPAEVSARQLASGLPWRRLASLSTAVAVATGSTAPASLAAVNALNSGPAPGSSGSSTTHARSRPAASPVGSTRLSRLATSKATPASAPPAPQTQIVTVTVASTAPPTAAELCKLDAPATVHHPRVEPVVDPLKNSHSKALANCELPKPQKHQGDRRPATHGHARANHGSANVHTAPSQTGSPSQASTPTYSIAPAHSGTHRHGGTPGHGHKTTPIKHTHGGAPRAPIGNLSPHPPTLLLEAVPPSHHLVAPKPPTLVLEAVPPSHRLVAPKHHAARPKHHAVAPDSERNEPESSPAPSTESSPAVSNVFGNGLGPNPAAGELMSKLAKMFTNLELPPPFLIPIYKRAARHYHVPWQVLAAINSIETDYGRNLNVSSAGAIGWMQFMPGTWAEYGIAADHHGKPNPYDPADAIFAAARYLRANGAPKNMRRAIFAYNHANWYVDEVLLRAQMIIEHNLRPSSAARLKIAAMKSMAELLNGDPYIYGGGHADWAIQPGYDCSGFVSAVLHAGGYLTVPVNTQALPDQPGILKGPGRYVTIFDRTDAPSVSEDHVIIYIHGQWWESGGSSSAGGGPMVHRMKSVSPAYLASFNRLLHPRGL